MSNFFNFVEESLNQIAEFFDMIGNVIGSIFKPLVLLFEILSNGLTLAFRTISMLPSWLTSFAITTIVVSIVYLLVGRESGK